MLDLKSKKRRRRKPRIYGKAGSEPTPDAVKQILFDALRDAAISRTDEPASISAIAKCAGELRQAMKQWPSGVEALKQEAASMSDEELDAEIAAEKKKKGRIELVG